MAAIMVANMAAIKTTKPYSFWTVKPILLKIGRYIIYMILHLLGHTNYYSKCEQVMSAKIVYLFKSFRVFEVNGGHLEFL